LLPPDTARKAEEIGLVKGYQDHQRQLGVVLRHAGINANPIPMMAVSQQRMQPEQSSVNS
jgi:hypothetical protein